MTDGEKTTADATMSSPRLEQFQEEVGKLKVTGGGANPERLGSQWGIGLCILGFVIAIISWWSALDGPDAVTGIRAICFTLIGVAVAVVGIAIWVRNSITRYLRYWMIRLVYEQREQTERLVNALRDK